MSDRQLIILLFGIQLLINSLLIFHIEVLKNRLEIYYKIALQRLPLEVDRVLANSYLDKPPKKKYRIIQEIFPRIFFEICARISEKKFLEIKRKGNHERDNTTYNHNQKLKVSN